MIKIDSALLQSLSNQAKASPRLRKNLNFHPRDEDTLQRMLNAMEPDTYIQPHKHENPDKTEAFFCLKGKLLVVEFDDKGQVTDYCVLDPLSGRFGCEIPPRTWHCIISLESGSVAYEVKDGPYNPLIDKRFAEWSPPEGDPEAMNYVRLLKQKLGL